MISRGIGGRSTRAVDLGTKTQSEVGQTSQEEDLFTCSHLPLCLKIVSKNSNR